MQKRNLVLGTALALGLALPLPAGAAGGIDLESPSIASATGAATAPENVAEFHQGVYPPDSKPFGKTYGEWGLDWWRWELAIPLNVTPTFDPDGAQCAINQHDKVWFLAGSSIGPVTRSCTIPKGKALFFPLNNREDDYPCPNDPSWEPAPGQSLEDFLLADAMAAIDKVNRLFASVDGWPIDDLFSFRGTSGLGGFTGAGNLNPTFDDCITGSPQLIVSDGYWLMLQPLHPGQHVIHWESERVGGKAKQDVTYNLTVE